MNLTEIVIISVSIVSCICFLGFLLVLGSCILAVNKEKKTREINYKKQISELQSKLFDERRINEKLKRQLK